MSLLFIHGVGGRPRSWTRVLDVLDPTLRREAVLADVRPQAGQSIAAIAARLRDQHPGVHVVVGHSLGGMLAQEVTLADRTQVRGLVLISTIPGTTPAVASHNETLAADIENRGLRLVAGEFADRLLAPGRSARDPSITAEFVEAMADSGTAAVCAGLRAITRWDATARLAELSCPAEVIAGSAEPDLDRQRQLAALLGAPFEIIDDTGHLAPVEAPGHVARTIERLCRRLPG